MEHFLSQHGVDICFFSEIFLNPKQIFRPVNYVCQRTDRPTAGGGTAITVRHVIVHHSLLVPGLNHLEATANQVTLGRQTGGSSCSLHFAFPPTDRSGTDPLFGKGFDGFDAWRPQRQTRGMELEAEYETEETPT